MCFGIDSLRNKDITLHKGSPTDSFVIHHKKKLFILWNFGYKFQ